MTGRGGMALMLMSARMFEANDTIMERDALPGDAAISGRRLTEHCHERGAGTLGSLNGKGVWTLAVSGCYSGRLHEPMVAAAEEAQSWCAEEDGNPGLSRRTEEQRAVPREYGGRDFPNVYFWPVAVLLPRLAR